MLTELQKWWDFHFEVWIFWFIKSENVVKRWILWYNVYVDGFENVAIPHKNDFGLSMANDVCSASYILWMRHIPKRQKFEQKLNFLIWVQPDGIHRNQRLRCIRLRNLAKFDPMIEFIRGWHQFDLLIHEVFTVRIMNLDRINTGLIWLVVERQCQEWNFTRHHRNHRTILHIITQHLVDDHVFLSLSHLLDLPQWLMPGPIRLRWVGNCTLHASCFDVEGWLSHGHLADTVDS